MGICNSTAIAELKRRQDQRKLELLATEKLAAERAKQMLREKLSEDAIFSITYVPFVIAEVAWDYADSVMDMAILMRIQETKRLCRAIKDIRKEYDKKRYSIITDGWRKSETENMVMFQDELKDVFNKIYIRYKDLWKMEYGEANSEMLLMICGAYMCHTVLKALYQYESAQMKIVSSIIGYQIAPFLPTELKALYDLIIEFAGNCPMPKPFKEIENEFAKELTTYIVDVELNDTDNGTKSLTKCDKSNSKTTGKTKYDLTMKELIQKLGETANAFISNATENIEKGNKAAGVRARKASLELEKLMKEYRKRSVNPNAE